MSDKKDKLRKMVIEFVKAEPGYNPQKQEKLWAASANKEFFKVVYGKDEMSGIMGVGKTVDLAFTDFVSRWKELNGFAWIEKNR